MACSVLGLKLGRVGKKVLRLRGHFTHGGCSCLGQLAEVTVHPHAPPWAGPITIPTLQMNKLILRGAEGLAQRPAGTMQQSQDLNPVPLTPTPTRHCLHRCQEKAQ